MEEIAAAVRLLRADEIECRVGIVNEKGASLLLFKDARVDQRILDETFGPFGWRRTHQASDSFKRACFNWGIGRELYTAPFIWIPAGKVELQKRENRYVVLETFHVACIEYDGKREIRRLEIQNARNMTVFQMRKGMADSVHQVRAALKAGDAPEQVKSSGTAETSIQRGVSDMLQDWQIAELQSELERTCVTLDTVLNRYRLEKLEDMTQEIYKKAMNSLKRSRSRDGKRGVA